jgi:hypothetical protein
VSLLLANGHPDAGDYPIAMVWDEAEIVVDRKNGELVTVAVVIQKATSTTGMTAGAEAVKAFNDFIRGLTGEA